MAIERPTFHEAWYRVANLRPRLLSSVRVHRQHFRNQRWYLLENTGNNQFSRVTEQTYLFVALLDGRRSVSEVWRICNERLGDQAPTQSEIIQVLGVLHGANLLYVELPPDSEVLFNRCRSRVRREVKSSLTNLLCVRIPLINPNAILDRWVHVLGAAFSFPGFILWLLLLGVGLYVAVGNVGKLISQSNGVLNPNNIFLLYMSFIFIKVVHEFSHAFACKKFGLENRDGGQVYNMGVMLLVFCPVPYIDASSAWAFRSKWHRVVVGLAGVLAELAIAATATIVWANTSVGTVHAIAYNIMFVAGVSTLLFNGNPLMRFDAYYVLSDIIEIPNLSQRSRQYLYYLFKRYILNLKKAWNPAFTTGERAWFCFYGCAATLYRVFISIRILLFLNERLPETLSILVPALAFSALIGWVIVPVGTFIQFLATGAELARNRMRAVVSTAGIALTLTVILGLVNWPDYCRVEGVLEPVELSVVHMAADGFITSYLPSQQAVSPEGPPVIEAVNRELQAKEQALSAERRAVQSRQRQALTQDVATAQVLKEQLSALDEKMGQVQEQLSSLHLAVPVSGTWVSPEIDSIKGRYVRRGDQIGIVANLTGLLVRATAGQNIAAVLIEQADRQVEIRANGRPDLTLSATLDKVYPAGQEQLPSQALGYAAGGSVATDREDPSGRKTEEMFFEVRVLPQWDDGFPWRTGQRVVVRIRLTPKPLISQLWHYGRQLFQRRFHV